MAMLPFGVAHSDKLVARYRDSAQNAWASSSSLCKPAQAAVTDRLQLIMMELLLWKMKNYDGFKLTFGELEP